MPSSCTRPSCLRGFSVGVCAPPTGLSVSHPLPCAYMPSPVPRRRRPAISHSRTLAVPVAGSLPRDPSQAASALTVSRLAQSSLALRPAPSLSRPTEALFHGSASVHFVTSTNRSDCYRRERTSCQAGLPLAAVLSTAHEFRSSETSQGKPR